MAPDLSTSVSAVIPTYRRGRVLLDTINHLLELKAPPREIIVADQTEQHGSATHRALQTLADVGQIRWLRLSSPSIPAAMNQGLLVALSDIVLFLDDDIVPGSELITAHSTAHGILAGRLIAGRVLQPWHHGLADTADKRPFTFNTLEAREVSEFMGGNFSVGRNDALAIGGFDENFVRVAYRFEAEFAYRWCRSGRRIRYEPAALIYHLKIVTGGTRKFGMHLTTIRPDHAVGAYYYFLRTNEEKRIFRKFAQRLLRSIITRHHLRHPWWIPATLIAETRGAFWAYRLARKGPAYVDNNDISISQSNGVLWPT